MGEALFDIGAELVDEEPIRLPPWRTYNVRRTLEALHGRAAPKKTKVSHGAKLALLLIMQFEVAYFGIPWLADILEVEWSTARGYVAELERAGLIWRHDNTNGFGGDSTNTYEVLLEPDESLRSRGGASRSRWHSLQDLRKKRRAASGQGDLPFAEQTPYDGRDAAASFPRSYSADSETETRGGHSNKGTSTPYSSEAVSPSSEVDGAMEGSSDNQGSSAPYALEREQPRGQLETCEADDEVGSKPDATTDAEDRPDNDQGTSAPYLDRGTVISSLVKAEAKTDFAKRSDRVPLKDATPPATGPRLRDCRSELIDTELTLKLLQLPMGRPALRKLEQSELTTQQAERAVKRVLQWDAVRGVSNAVGFITNVIKDIQQEGFDHSERVEVSRRVAPSPRLNKKREELDSALLAHPENRRTVPSSAVERFLAMSPKTADVLK